MTDDLPLVALNECVKRAGSKAQLARDLNLSQPSVWNWFERSKRMPAEHVLKAEELYGVSRHDLREDIYPVDCPPSPARLEAA